MRRVLLQMLALAAMACGGRDSATSAVSTAQSNVVTNGSFESLCDGQTLPFSLGAGNWNVFLAGERCPDGYAIPGWFSDPNGVEIQARTFGPGADGAQYAELDPYHPSAIWQDVATTVGSIYDLKVAFRTRPDNTFDDSAVNVKWNGVTAIALSSAVPGSEAWVHLDANVVATGTTSRITLEDASADNEYGGLVDDVQLVYVGCMLDGAPVLDTKACDARRR